MGVAQILTSLHGRRVGLGYRDELILDAGVKTATASSGAATANGQAFKITSEALSTAAGSAYTLTVTNASVAAGDVVLASVALGTATTGQPVVETVTPAAGSVVIVVRNRDGSAAFNGTIVVSGLVWKA